jgi:peptidoglycan hydrolase CwlO-like protein
MTDHIGLLCAKVNELENKVAMLERENRELKYALRTATEKIKELKNCLSRT